MSSNIPDNLKDNWVSNEIVMPVDTNLWASSINKLAKAVPLYAHTGNYYTATYSSNTYNLSPLTYPDSSNNVSISGYFDGMSVCFICPADNLADSSINVNSLGTKSIKTLENLNIPAGKLQMGCFVELKYDSNNNCFKFIQDLNKQDKLYSGTNIKTIEGISLLGSGNIDILPTQEGNEGKYLSTDGVVPVWANNDWGIIGIINDGYVDSNGKLDLFNATELVNTVYEFKEADEQPHYITLAGGDYDVILVGGGGAGAGSWNYPVGVTAVGGSGAGFSGKITLSAGTYIVEVGGNTRSGNRDTILKDANNNIIIKAGGGGNGSASAWYNTGAGGTGGTLTNNATVVGIPSLSTNGNNGSWASGSATSTGGLSVYDGTHTGYGAGGLNSWQANSVTGLLGQTGYFKLVETSTPSTEINYNVSIANPLIITDYRGKQSTFYGLDTDIVSNLTNGTYNKFIDSSGSELIENTIYRQLKQPSSPLTNDVWVRLTNKIKCYKYNGSSWVEYNKVWLGSVLITDGAVTKIEKADLCDNYFNVTSYQLKDYRKLVEIANYGSAWYKIYEEYNPLTGEFVGKWCEQGSVATASAGTSFNKDTVFNLSKEFKDTDYTIIGNAYGNGYPALAWACYQSTKTTKTFTGHGAAGTNNNLPYHILNWVAWGYVN